MRMQSIYDILSLKSVKEAEEDNTSSASPADMEGSIDDDFSIDTSLDDGSSPEEDAAQQAEENPEAQQQNPESDQGMSDADNPGDPGPEGVAPVEDEEEVEANTDIFASLTAEEQQIKIKELKTLYSNLYSSCDDILNRINKLDVNEENLETISRISTALYDVKIYISDYLTMVFPTKSYVENDVTFVRFLSIIKSITEILDDVAKKFDKDNSEKKQ